MEKYYHATPYENLGDIICNGINAGIDGLVYMCKQPKEAASFIAIRGIKDILVVEIKVYKAMEKNVIETFDHSEAFFKCRAFGYKGNIDTKYLGKFTRYQL